MGNFRTHKIINGYKTIHYDTNDITCKEQMLNRNTLIFKAHYFWSVDYR